jgi:hypothetical protein
MSKVGGHLLVFFESVGDSPGFPGKSVDGKQIDENREEVPHV